MNIIAVILAAGEGKRMKSSIPKVLHTVLKRPMILYVIDAVKALHPQDILIVVGKSAEEIKGAIRDQSLRYVAQRRPLGTGHALDMAKRGAARKIKSTILVLNGDCPLITADALRKLIANHRRDRNDLSFFSFVDPALAGYGRVLRDDMNRVVAIIEDKHIPADQKNVQELNGGVYVMEPKILDFLGQVKKNRSSGEYYLTDIVGISFKEGKKVNAYPCDPEIIRGVNTRAELLEIAAILDRRAAS